jgi:hypothetical protein
VDAGPFVLVVQAASWGSATEDCLAAALWYFRLPLDALLNSGEVDCEDGEVETGASEAEFGGADCWRLDRTKPSSLGVTGKRNSLFR